MFIYTQHFSIGTAELRMETGRWVALGREHRICAQCCSGEVENVEHFILRCGQLIRERNNAVETHCYVTDSKRVNFLSEYVARRLNTPGRFGHAGLRHLKKLIEYR